MIPPLVVKFGGDALATPERIAAASRWIEQRLEAGPVVTVASARRGMTDHLLGLVERVKENTAKDRNDSRALSAAADRAVAAGELVAASLLAVALNHLGVPAEVLDAREAGLRSDGQWTRAQLTRLEPDRIARLLQRGITPVVTGFQGWHRGYVTTLGRGGSDTTAVALAAALHAERCELVKHVGGLLTADPRVVPEARPIARASHHFLTTLAGAGAKVISLRAAALAEREAVPLRFSSLENDAFSSGVSQEAVPNTLAVALRSGRYRFTAHVPSRIEANHGSAFLATIAAAGIPAELEVTEDGTGSRLDLLVDPADLEACLKAARRLLPRGRHLALLATSLTTVTVVGDQPDRSGSLQRTAHASGVPLLHRSVSQSRASFLVADAGGAALARALHGSLVAPGHKAPEEESPSPIHHLLDRRSYVGQR